MLVECEEGQFGYKLVVYDNSTQENNILAVYGIGEKLYNENITNFDQMYVAKFLTELEDRRYDNKQVFERVLRAYSKNVGYILWRYNSRSHRFNKYGRKIPQSRGIVQQQYDGRGVHQSGQTVEVKRKIHSDEFDPYYDETGNTPTDASKLMGGNRHGNSSEQRVTLDLADDYYQIATDSRYNYSREEIGKSTDTHKDVTWWH